MSALLTMLAEALLGLAYLGTLSSTVFLALVLVAALRSHRRARQQRRDAELAQARPLPFVSIVKPLHGAEPQLEANLASFFAQDYPNFELLFAVRSADDAALRVVEWLRARFPQVTAKVILTGEPEWPSAKVWSLAKMAEAAAGDYLVISDSDILVGTDLLRQVIPPLLEPRNGLVTCLYRGIPARDVWSRLEALGMSVEMPSGVVTADLLEGMKFALGAVMAVRRDALQQAGGMAALADYYSDDFVLGNRVHAAGFNVVLSHYRVGHVLEQAGWAGTLRTQLRWMQSTRYSRPLGHLGTGLTFATPFGLLALLAGAACGQWEMGFALFAWSLANRVTQCVAVGYGLIGDRRALRDCWLYPLRDLLGFGVWAASYLGGSGFHWRGELYHFTPGGKIVAAQREAEE